MTGMIFVVDTPTALSSHLLLWQGTAEVSDVAVNIAMVPGAYKYAGQE
jgi:hypothetical protein